MKDMPYDCARVIQVVQTTLLRRGEGKSEGDPVRVIEQFWSLDGELLAENDRWKQGRTFKIDIDKEEK